MKRCFLLLFFIILYSPFIKADNDPIADPNAIVVSGDMRFTVLTPEMIRIEWSDKQLFEDRASFTVVNRKLPVPSFTVEEREGFLYIETEKLSLQYRIGSFPGTLDVPSSKNLKITFEMDGRTHIWYPWKRDNLNLKGTTRTLDSSNGDNKLSEMENGILSRSGWAVIDETEIRQDGSISLVFNERENGVDWVEQRADQSAMDWYFMGYGRNYKKALSDFTKIAGKIPMPPLYAFGYWYSKYEEYSADDFKNLVLEMEENEVPLDVMVIDMDWHYSGSPADNNRGGWTGWTWNTRLIPDPPALLGWLHDKNLKATLNLHPADGVATDEENFSALANELGLPTDKNIDWNIENEDFYKAFFKNILRPHEDIGVDFWWLDWQQWLLATNEDKLSNTFWLNHVFYEDMKLQNKGRPMIFHRWGGLGNHRYQIGFSGDAHANFPTLAFQPYFTSTASNVGYGYWSHDVGGHYQDGDNDPELFLRWIQYSVFSPIVRTHSTKDSSVERRVWKYPNYPLMKEALDLRYAMIPYIYTQARVAYDTGVSICRPLYYDWPDNNESYKNGQEYMFGDDILAAPIVERANSKGISEKEIWLPEGMWYEVMSGEILEGNNSYVRTFKQNEIPYYYREGAIIPHFPKLSHLKDRPDKLILKFAPGSSGELRYYEDENDNDNYKNSEYTFTHITQNVTEEEGFYVINSVEGAFAEMLTERSYDIELLATNLPKEVKVNGEVYNQSDTNEFGTWNYDSDKKIVRIYLPKVSCYDKTEIYVQFDLDNTQIKPTVAQNSATVSYVASENRVNVNFAKVCNQINLSVFELGGENIYSTNYTNTQDISFVMPNVLSKGAYLIDLEYDSIKQIEKLVL